MHYHGIIHRDIKGANILVDTDGLCKLAGKLYWLFPFSNTINKDFGLAKSIASIEKKEAYNIPQGTPNWMAPEVCR